MSTIQAMQPNQFQQQLRQHSMAVFELMSTTRVSQLSNRPMVEPIWVLPKLRQLATLVIPQAMGVEVLMEEGKGPSLPKTIKTQADINALVTTGAEESLKYVYDALSLTKKELNGRVPLIGFAGAPWTILCYMVEGKGSKTWDKAKQFAYTQPLLAHSLLQKITDITIQYLKLQ